MGKPNTKWIEPLAVQAYLTNAQRTAQDVADHFDITIGGARNLLNKMVDKEEAYLHSTIGKYSIKVFSYAPPSAKVGIPRTVRLEHKKLHGGNYMCGSSKHNAWDRRE